MAPAFLDPINSLAFCLYSSPGVYALLVGSGVSRPAGIPTGWEIVEELIRDVARLEGLESLQQPTDWYRSRFSEEPTYGAILEQVAPLPAERRNVLRRFFEPDPAQPTATIKKPTAAHHAIAQLVVNGFVRLIVTTNFDRLLEMALTAAGAHFQVVASADAIKGMQPLSHGGCTVLKVNGDYLDARIRNTAGELQEYDAETTELLDRICDEFGLVICGWSADWDLALRAALQRRASRRYSVYWTVRSTPSTLTTDLINSTRAVQIAIKGADEFFPVVADKVTALRAIAAPHPLSAQMAVASLKSFIEEERPIKLHDLIVSETERLYAAISEVHFTEAHAPIDATTIKLRLDRYHAATGTLVALIGHGCHWADEHRSLYLRSIQRLANPPGTWNGLEFWLNFRRYPALLLFYAAGLAATVRGDLDFLKALVFEMTVRDKSGSKAQPLDALVVYDVLDARAVQLLFAPERRKTPLSDIVHDAMRSGFHDLVPADDEYSDVFDRFEIMIGLLFADSHETWPGAPTGRFAWRRRDGQGMLEVIRQEENAAADAWPPYRAGFFGSSRDRFVKAFEKVARSASQVAFL
jgi:hypothetical protein